MSMRNILLVCKAGHAGAQALGREVEKWLAARKLAVTTISAGHDDPAYAGEIDLAVVLGGDGTMLGVARRVACRGIPVTGINFGRVGFLTDAQPDAWQPWLEACLGGTLPRRSCMALAWKLFRGDPDSGPGGKTCIDNGLAINDVVLSRGPLARLVSMAITVDKENLGIVRSDGLVISTPLGSTSYCVSAGGPLIHPGLNALTLTPICPFLNTIAPTVFSGESRIHIEICKSSTDSYLTVDGQEGQMLRQGDLVEFCAKPDAVLFLGAEIPFAERLRTRNFVLDQANNP